jgi:hypothetical protein
MATAPICPVPGAEPIGQPGGANIPSIPVANDLESAIAAVNTMRIAIGMLAGHIRPSNKQVKPGHQGGSFGSHTKDSNNAGKNGNWNEIKRTVKRVRVSNPDDESQFVDVDRIDNFTMRHRISGDTWVWNRNRT